MSTKTTRILMLLLGAAGMFFLGGLWQKRNILNLIENTVAGLSSQASAPYGNTFVHLNSRTVDVGKAISTEAEAWSGGIHVRGNEAIGVTRRGSFFLYRSGAKPSVSKLDIGIRNQFDAFVAAIKKRGYDAVKASRRFRFIDLVFAEDGDDAFIIVSHHQWHPEKECFTLNFSRLAVGSWDNLTRISARAQDWTTLFETRPCLRIKTTGEWFAGHHHGGRMAVGSNGRLLVTIGDFNFDGFNAPENHPQDPNADYGKVLSIGIRKGDRKIVSVGHRNPQGLTIDREGNIWSTEHGPQGGDELNLIREGGNYGWPMAINGTHYRQIGWPMALEQGRHVGYASPAYAWMPSVGISNLIQVHDFAPQWDGDLLVASLNGGTIFRMRYKEGAIRFAEPIYVGTRVRDIGQFDNHAIVLWTDKGELIELTRGTAPVSPSDKALETVLADLDGIMKQKVTTTVDSCVECHAASPAGSSTSAPNLWNVYRRRIAATPFPGYSQALRNRDGLWTEESLNAFLSDGEAFAPDNAMGYPGISDPEVRRKVVEYLKALH